MDMGSIIAVGSINVDMQASTDRMPESGEALPVRRFLMHGGGKAANVAYLARLLGVPSMSTSALAVTRFGSQPAYPTREEVEKLLSGQA